MGAARLGMIGGWSTPIGYGPFTGTADTNAIVLFQIYLGAMTVAALLIAVLVADLTEREVISARAGDGGVSRRRWRSSGNVRCWRRTPTR